MSTSMNSGRGGGGGPRGPRGSGAGSYSRRGTGGTPAAPTMAGGQQNAQALGYSLAHGGAAGRIPAQCVFFVYTEKG